MTGSPKPKPNRCPRNANGEHRWQPGPVVEWESWEAEGPRHRQRARAVLIICECGGADRLPVPEE